MTNYEKNIYNIYNKVLRDQQDKPFKYRKNFKGFEDTENYNYVKRLSKFFNTYKHVDPETFFEAPYKVYQEESVYYLDYYAKPKAIKTYTLYKQKQENAAPDSPEQIKNTTDSIYYIYRYCKDNGIKVRDYLNHMTGNTNTFLVHLKENKINLYSLFGLDQFDNITKKIDSELTEFMLPGFYNKLDTFRLKMYNSEKLHKVVKEGYSFVKSATKA